MMVLGKQKTSQIILQSSTTSLQSFTTWKSMDLINLDYLSTKSVSKSYGENWGVFDSPKSLYVQKEEEIQSAHCCGQICNTEHLLRKWDQWQQQKTPKRHVVSLYRQLLLNNGVIDFSLMLHKGAELLEKKIMIWKELDILNV